MRRKNGNNTRNNDLIRKQKTNHDNFNFNIQRFTKNVFPGLESPTETKTNNNESTKLFESNDSATITMSFKNKITSFTRNFNYFQPETKN